RCTSLTTRFVSCRSPAPPYPYPLSLHDALPFSYQGAVLTPDPQFVELTDLRWIRGTAGVDQVLERLGGQIHHELPGGFHIDQGIDRKSTRLNSSHVSISYAVFCLKKKILLSVLN